MKACSASVVPGYVSGGGRSQGHLQLAAGPCCLEKGVEKLDSQRKSKNPELNPSLLPLPHLIINQCTTFGFPTTPSARQATTLKSREGSNLHNNALHSPTWQEEINVLQPVTLEKLAWIVLHFITLCSFSLLKKKEKKKRKKRLTPPLTPRQLQRTDAALTLKLLFSSFYFL